MNAKSLAAVCLLAMLAISCATIDVDFDYDHASDFTTYKTYNWVDGFTTPLETSNPLLHKQIVTLIEEELNRKGYQKSDNPDMAIVYTTTSKEMKEVSTQTTYYAHGYYRGWWYDPMWGAGATTARVDTYTEGTLMIGFFDTETEKLIWRGWATATIRDPRDLDQIGNAIDYMLSKFPPGQ